MRKVVSITLTLLLVFAAELVYGQGYTFRVLANKGQNTVKKAGSAAAVALKTGATLNTGDELIASQGAYIGLMHKSGKTLEVRTPGSQKVADLEKKINTKTASVSTRYATFLAAKMNEKENTNYRSRLNATGAVSRALAGDASIKVLLPNEVKVIGDNAIIGWDSPEGIEQNEYVVTVKNIFDEEIYKEEVAGNAINLDFNNPELKNDEGLYILTVKAKENLEVTSGAIGIKKLKGEDASQYSEGIGALQSEVAEDGPLGKIIYASFYEENGLILDALTKMQEAIDLSPDVEDFEELRKDILERNGIKIFAERND
ncbi:MAG: hypothetical protein ABJG78_01960 [Cyclobacteriaceae bacterium]